MTNKLHCHRCNEYQPDATAPDSPCPECGGILLDYVVPEAARRFHMRRRKLLIDELGGIDEYLGLPRTIVPKHRRKTGKTNG